MITKQHIKCFNAIKIKSINEINHAQNQFILDIWNSELPTEMCVKISVNINKYCADLEKTILSLKHQDLLKIRLAVCNFKTLLKQIENEAQQELMGV
jgi:hypothetical protein